MIRKCVSRSAARDASPHLSGGRAPLCDFAKSAKAVFATKHELVESLGLRVIDRLMRRVRLTTWV
jgi:hypothetical protein